MPACPAPRLRLAGAIHHVALRGRDRQALFRAPADRDVLDGLVGATLAAWSARAHAYCWMTNHLHLVVEVAPAAAGDLARDLTDRYERTGLPAGRGPEPLFAPTAPPCRVDAEGYLLQLIRYVHLNPVRAGLVRDAADYPWSGHRTYLGRGGPPWLSTDLGLRLLGGDLLRAVAAYRVFVAPVGAPPRRESLVDCRAYPGRY
jgi:putative transposase